MKLLRLGLIALYVFLAPAAFATTVGFYAANFDPPTRSQLRIIGCALGDPGLPQACQEIAKNISRLVVLVNEDSSKDTLASTRERLLMVKRVVQKYGDKIEVYASTAASRELRKRALLADRKTAQVIQFLDADSYKDLKSSRIPSDPRLSLVIFPLEAEPAPFDARAAGKGSVEPSVAEIIRTLSLYQGVSSELAELQKSLFEEGWKDFLDDLQSACPVTLKSSECGELSSSWKNISIATADQGEAGEHKDAPAPPQLIYRKGQSEDRWAEKYTETALHPLQGTESYDQIKPVADDIAARTLRGYPRGKVPHIRPISVMDTKLSPNALTVTRKPLVCPAPQGSYHADMDQYVADRFPRAFADFLKREIKKGLISPGDLYVHNHPVEDAYGLHKRDRYSDFYFVQTRRGQLHRDIHLAVRSNPRSYRVVLTSVRGKDRAVNVLCQVHYNGIFSTYRLVRAKQEQPLFVLNPQGRALQLNEADMLLFGFRGTWRRLLRKHNWQQTSLVREGLDVDLFTHPTIKQKLVVARNVYGDDGNIILNTFYRKGIRRTVYLGSAGAIQNYQLGDIVIPDEFVDRHGNVVPFKDNFGLAYQSELSQLLTVHANQKHAWAQSLFEETTDVLLDWKAKRVGAVDIEGLHLGRFAMQHPDLKLAALFVISDQTLGESTIEETNAARGLIDESVDKLVAFLMPKVVDTH